MIKVVVEHDLQEVETVELGEIEVSDLPAIKDALMGQEVFLNGGRRVYRSVLHQQRGQTTLAFQYGDEE